MNKKSPESRFHRRLAATALFLSAAAAAAAPSDDPLRARLRWVPAELGEGQVTLDAQSRLLLARSAADKAALQEVGLDFRDVYGVINAETSWVPRTGMGKNGVASVGLGQFEPATAKAVGLRNPHDAVEAVYAAARLLREAAVWSARRVSHLALSPEQRAAKLREGISIYYNLSSRARAAWNGRDTHKLPVETQRHIRNVREGAQQADRLNARLGGPQLAPLPAPDLPAVARVDGPAAVAAATAKPAAPQAVGTIEWSGKGGEGPGAGRRSYVVFSNGTVRPQGGTEAPAAAIRFTPRGKG